MRNNKKMLTDNTTTSSKASEALPTPSSTSQHSNSFEAVRAKIKGESFTLSHYKSILKDIAENKYSLSEISAFFVANSFSNSPEEALHITQALIDQSNQLKWDKKIIVDIQSASTSLSNPTNLLARAIIIASDICSFNIDFSNSHDSSVIEVLTKTNFTIEEVTKIIHSTNGGFFKIENHSFISPAYKTLQEVRNTLRIDTLESIASDIIFSAIITGVTHLIVDIPVGGISKISSIEEAIHLRTLLEYISHKFSLFIDVVITDSSTPIGLGEGAALEAKDVMQVLSNAQEAPQNLRDKAVFLASRALTLVSNTTKEESYNKATEVLNSGKALEVMKLIIDTQSSSSPSNATKV